LYNLVKDLIITAMKQLTKNQKTILQLADRIQLAKNYLKSKGDMPIYLATVLDWDEVVDDDIKQAMNELYQIK